MGSYILLQMLSAFMNTLRPDPPSIGDYFLQVLKYYGTIYQWERMSIFQGELIGFDRKFEGEGLEVLDYYFPNTNSAANVTKYEEIRMLFKNSYDKLIALSNNFTKNASILKDLFEIAQ